jgi:hypothetical protein
MTAEQKGRLEGETAAEFEQRSKEVFDRSTAALDGATRSKLTRARREALSALERPSRMPGWLFRRSAAIAAAVMVTTFSALVVWQAGTEDRRVVESFAGSTDIELLLSEEELDMLDELEFYAWLEEQAEIDIPEA